MHSPVYVTTLVRVPSSARFAMTKGQPKDGCKKRIILTYDRSGNFPEDKSALATVALRCDQIWRCFVTLAIQVFDKFLTVSFSFGKMLSLLWNFFDILGLIFIVANGQILKIIQPSGHTD